MPGGLNEAVNRVERPFFPGKIVNLRAELWPVLVDIRSVFELDGEVVARKDSDTRASTTEREVDTIS